ncbi:MAG: PTS sugar transporter subunit IIA [Anaerolineaceae bacterium]|nr:PTS sugar transporter subunit IIA [Anaerolineaceae bacterium]
MVGILIVSHGKLAEGLIDALKMIVGDQEAVDYLSLNPGDSVEALTGKITTAVESLNRGEGVLIMTDLFGASPFNASGMATQSSNFPIDVITGFNLGMMIETVLGREGKTLSEISNLAFTSGVSSIKKLSDLIDLS